MSLTGRSLALLGSLAVAVCALTTTAAASTAPAPSPTPSMAPSAAEPGAEAIPELQVSILDQSPAVVRPDDTLRLTLSVENATAADLTDPLVTIGVQQEVPRTRGALLGWFNPDTPPRARTEWRSPLTATVPAGGSATVRVDIPMAELDFPVRFDNWGARGLEVSLTGRDGASGVARTTGLFYPAEFVATPVTVATLVPATPTAEEWTGTTLAAAAGAVAQAPSAEQLAPPAATERAATLLATGSDVALDPVLARALAALDHDPRSRSSVLALPWADADLATLPLAGTAGTDLLADSLNRGTVDFAAAPIAAAGTILWPAAAGDVTPEALAKLTEVDALGAVLERQVLDRDLNAELANLTPPARVDVETASGPLGAVIGDPVLGALLIGDTDRVGLSGRFVDLVNPDVLARQLALGYTAVVAREQSDPVGLLAVIPRADAANLTEAEVADVDERVAAILAQPWVTTSTVAGMLAEPAAATDAAADLVGAVLGDTSPLTPGRQRVLDRAAALEDEAAALASAFPDGSGLTGLDPTLDIVGSTAWRLAGHDGSIITNAVAAALDSVYDAVTVTVPSGVNLAANDGAIPVTLTNELAVPVTAHIEAVPEQFLLRVHDLDDIRLEAGTSQSVSIPVEAIVNGSTRVDVTVTSPGGAVLGSAAAFDVQVRAEWEGTATAIAAAALAALFIVGLVRAVRRGRRGADGLTPLAPRPGDRVARDLEVEE